MGILLYLSSSEEKQYIFKKCQNQHFCSVSINVCIIQVNESKDLFFLQKDTLSNVF